MEITDLSKLSVKYYIFYKPIIPVIHFLIILPICHSNTVPFNTIMNGTVLLIWVVL